MKHTINKKTFLYIILSGIVITNSIIAEVIGVKIISLEALFNLPPSNFTITEGLVINFNLTAGVIVWPIVFITTDIINEYYGTDGVKRITYLTISFIAYIFIIIWTATNLPPAAFWQNNNEGFVNVFSVGLNIIIGSLAAFFISQFLDAYIFHSIRKITGSKKIWLRATGSTLVSQLADSFVVIIIAFYILAEEKWTTSQILSVCLSNYIYKFLVAIILTPLLYLAHSLIDKYLGNESEQLQKLASED
jgi:uncharacterized integral membrane protein (TIGR00697 family)